MATYNLDRSDLNDVLTPNIDPSVRSAVLDYLYRSEGRGGHHGHGHGCGWGNDPGIRVQYSNGTDPIDSRTEALVLTSATATVLAEGGALRAIISNVDTGASLTVQGDGDVLVATGRGDDQVWLEDGGDRTVYTGDGNDTVYAGEGRD